MYPRGGRDGRDGVGAGRGSKKALGGVPLERPQPRSDHPISVGRVFITKNAA